MAKILSFEDYKNKKEEFSVSSGVLLDYKNYDEFWDRLYAELVTLAAEAEKEEE